MKQLNSKLQQVVSDKKHKMNYKPKPEHKFTFGLWIAFVLLTFIPPAQTQSPPAFKNPNLPVEARVNDLVSRLTLEEKVAQMMNATPAIERLGILPHDYWNEALHGVARSGIATVFPQAIGLAATWDTKLMFRGRRRHLDRGTREAS